MAIMIQSIDVVRIIMILKKYLILSLFNFKILLLSISVTNDNQSHVTSCIRYTILISQEITLYVRLEMPVYMFDRVYNF